MCSPSSTRPSICSARAARSVRADACLMPVHALWSAPRSRSTAFFRSMVERGDVLALHEPLEGLHFVGPVQVAGRTFRSAPELLHWLVQDATDQVVFLKETVNPPVQACVVTER